MKRTQTISSALESPSFAQEWPDGWDSFTTTQFTHYLNSHELRRRLEYYFDDHSGLLREGIVLQRPDGGVSDAMYATIILPVKRYRFESFNVRGTIDHGYEAMYDDELSFDKVACILEGDLVTAFQHPLILAKSDEPICEMVRVAESAFITRRIMESREYTRNIGRRLLSAR